MPYYEIELRGGDRADRIEYAQEYGLTAADYTGHAVVFVKEHGAQLDVFRRSYGSAAKAMKLEIKIDEIDKDRFRELFTGRGY